MQTILLIFLVIRNFRPRVKIIIDIDKALLMLHPYIIIPEVTIEVLVEIIVVPILQLRIKLQELQIILFILT